MKIPTHTLMAAIDIGSSAIRMDVAEIQSDGTIRVLDSLKKGVQLGREAFSIGHFSQETIRAACDALRDFKKVLDTYGVSCYRAVATSAVRESENSETFLDRLLISRGLNVEIINGPEENRLTLQAVMNSIREAPNLAKGESLLVEVGGGSTDVSLLNEGELQQSGTFPLGSIRLYAEDSAGPAKREQQIRSLKRQIASLLTVLTPIAIAPSRPLPQLPGLAVNLAVLLQSEKEPESESRLSVVQVPGRLPGLLRLPDGEALDMCWTHDAIRRGLPRLFMGYWILETAGFRLTRDAELELDDERKFDYVGMLKSELKKRRTAKPIRMEHEAMSPDLLERLKQSFEVTDESLFSSNGPLDATQPES